MCSGPSAPETAAMGHEPLPQSVVIQAPLIAPAMGIDLESFVDGMVAPDARAHDPATGLRSPGHTNTRFIEDPLQAVEPTIRPPGEIIEGFVGILIAKTIQKDLRGSIGHIITVSIGQKQQLRRGTDPDTSITQFKATGQIEPFNEDLPIFKDPISIKIFQNHQAILAGTFGLLFGIAQGLQYPKSPEASKVKAMG